MRLIASLLLIGGVYLFAKGSAGSVLLFVLAIPVFIIGAFLMWRHGSGDGSDTSDDSSWGDSTSSSSDSDSGGSGGGD